MQPNIIRAYVQLLLTLYSEEFTTDNGAGTFITPEKPFRIAALDRSPLATEILALGQKGNLAAW